MELTSVSLKLLLFRSSQVRLNLGLEGGPTGFWKVSIWFQFYLIQVQVNLRRILSFNRSRFYRKAIQMRTCCYSLIGLASSFCIILYCPCSF